MFAKITKNLIAVAILVGTLIIAGALIYTNQGKGEIISSQDAADKAITFINQNILAEGNTASLMEVSEDGSVYKIHLKIGEKEYDSYVSKDGKFLFPEGYSLELKDNEENQNENNTSPGIPKSDNPDVKLFVMSYCPFGLQAQKMFLPVYDLLKNKAEIGVYFVNYAMHEKQEIDENLTQYCIQKEEKEKYGDYLNCFLKDGNSEKCLSEVKVDGARLENCMSAADIAYNITAQYNDKSTWVGSTCPDSPYCFPKFDVHSDLNEKYGVRGSPAVIINDQIANINPRSPENFKEVICQTFNSPPEECAQNLSDDVPSSGFGEAAGSSSGGSCG